MFSANPIIQTLPEDLPEKFGFLGFIYIYIYIGVFAFLEYVGLWMFLTGEGVWPGL